MAQHYSIHPRVFVHTESFGLHVPRYLFRTFDVASSGWNDENMIASIANRNGPQENNRADILSRKTQYAAAQMLYIHPGKDCFGGDGQDDLLPWTSSHG
jgi:hypothetical protein